MKTLLRYLFLVLILAGTVSSCDWYSDPLELVYPGTDLSGKPDQGEEDENVKLGQTLRMCCLQYGTGDGKSPEQPMRTMN